MSVPWFTVQALGMGPATRGPLQSLTEQPGLTQKGLSRVSPLAYDTKLVVSAICETQRLPNIPSGQA